MRKSNLLVAALCLFALSSCATIPFNAKTIRDHAVKMNSAGEPEYDVVADFEIRDKAAWIIGIVPVNKPAGDKHDYLGTLIQAEIDKAGGDAAINVSIKAQFAAEDILVNVVTLGIYVPRTVTVTGQVVKYR
ncbi:MAG: Bor family protein [candidate division Zixibacteria bacterium]|nr:Bor family protein [candidate division Zixibacteria bacterium]